MDYKLEISTYNVAGVVEAYNLGADRVELCDNISEGGTTPSYGMIKTALNGDHPELYIIVRPRGGDFYYNEEEFEIMKQDIVMAKQLGVDGIVSGVLNMDATVDVERTKDLVELAKPMKFTFHRAFDMTPSYLEALEDIIETGADRILTSGQRDTALEGSEVIKDVINKAGDRINILAGSGLNAENIEELEVKTGVKEFHMSAVKYVNSKVSYRNPYINMGNTESNEYSHLDVDSEKIQKAVNKLKSLN